MKRGSQPDRLPRVLILAGVRSEITLTGLERVGFSWPLPSELDEASLEHRLFPSIHAVAQEKRQMPSLEYLHQELKKKGVTLQLLWHEYKEKHPDGYQYSQFCRIYHQWAEKLDPCLRQVYRAGEKLFVDYAGQTMEITDPETGEIHEAQIFVATLGASNYTFAEATLCQDLPSWIQSHVHAFEFFQGVTRDPHPRQFEGCGHAVLPL